MTIALIVMPCRKILDNDCRFDINTSIVGSAVIEKMIRRHLVTMSESAAFKPRNYLC